MHLKQYIQLERGRATMLAKGIDVSPSYLSQLASGAAPIQPKLAVRIECLTNGQVHRKDLFPNDWSEIWPELVRPDFAALVMAERRVIASTVRELIGLVGSDPHQHLDLSTT
ncbi:transcriptional regulator [Undibacterium sp. Ji42W]|uniref:transcriptional regulator n=1 Tax=Undibacterium sp. Ji42W TaxID=3413039 RepID=UPI003BF02F69